MQRNMIRRRNGYMLLVCTIAATVLSMASIAIIRSSQLQIRVVDAQRSNTEGKTVADGLYQRALATLRDDPKAEGTVVDPAIKTPGARAELTRISKDSTQIQIFLYDRSTVPALSKVIDPDEITGAGGGGKDKDKGKGKGKGKDNGKAKGKDKGK